LGQRLDRNAQPARHTLDPGDQDLLQPHAFDPDERADIVPQRVEIALRQYLARFVAEAPAPDARPRPLHFRIEVETAQHAYPVGLHGDPAALGAPHRAALDELHRES